MVIIYSRYAVFATCLVAEFDEGFWKSEGQRPKSFPGESRRRKKSISSAIMYRISSLDSCLLVPNPPTERGCRIGISWRALSNAQPANGVYAHLESKLSQALQADIIR